MTIAVLSVEVWGMNHEDTIRVHLRILAVYSILFCFAVCPLIWITLFSATGNSDTLVLPWSSALSHWWQVRGFLIAGLFASILSGIYWFCARAWLHGGAPVWPVHVTYWVAVAPLTFFWFSVLIGPIRNVLAP